MPLRDVKYRYKKGTKIRLAFRGKKVVEAKNMKTGDVWTKPKRAKKRVTKKKGNSFGRLT